jgi:hypothetical protein
MKGGQWCQPGQHTGGKSMWMPDPMRKPEFWFRITQVLKAIYDLARLWKSL